MNNELSLGMIILIMLTCNATLLISSLIILELIRIRKGDAFH